VGVRGGINDNDDVSGLSTSPLRRPLSYRSAEAAVCLFYNRINPFAVAEVGHVESPLSVIFVCRPIFN